MSNNTGVSPDVLGSAWKVKDVASREFQREGVDMLPYSTAFLQAVLSPENRAAARYNLQAVKDMLEVAQRDGKNGYSVKVNIQKPFTGLDPAQRLSFDCADSNSQVEYTNFQYNISRETVVDIKLDFNAAACSAEQIDIHIANTMRQLWIKAINQLNEDCLAALFEKNGAGKFRNIGNLVPRSGVARPAGEALPLLNPAGGINYAAEIQLLEDLRLANADSMGLRAFGATRPHAYFRTKGLAVAGNDEGIVTGGINLFGEGQFFYNERIASHALAAGVPDAFLIMRLGALQLATKAAFTRAEYQVADGNVTQTTMVDPYFGLPWDFRVIRTVCTDGGLPTYSYKVRLFWELISYPACDRPELPFQEGTNDVFLYQVTCDDYGVCQIPSAGRLPNGLVQYADGCETSNDSTCPPSLACTVGITTNYNENGSVTLQANFFPPDGGTVTSINWEQNSSTISTDQAVTIAATDWNNGDAIVLSVQYTRADGTTTCSASASQVLELSNNVANLEVVYDGEARVSSYKIESGNYTHNTGTKSVTITINRATATPVTVLGVAIGNTGVGQDAVLVDTETYPKVLGSGYSVTLQMDTTGAALGLNTATLMILSDAANGQPDYEIRWEYTVVAP